MTTYPVHLTLRVSSAEQYDHDELDDQVASHIATDFERDITLPFMPLMDLELCDLVGDSKWMHADDGLAIEQIFYSLGDDGFTCYLEEQHIYDSEHPEINAEYLEVEASFVSSLLEAGWTEVDRSGPKQVPSLSAIHRIVSNIKAEPKPTATPLGPDSQHRKISGKAK